MADDEDVVFGAIAEHADDFFCRADGEFIGEFGVDVEGVAEEGGGFCGARFGGGQDGLRAIDDARESLCGE